MFRILLLKKKTYHQPSIYPPTSVFHVYVSSQSWTKAGADQILFIQFLKILKKSPNGLLIEDLWFNQCYFYYACSFFSMPFKIERFSFKSRKTNPKAITMANHVKR